MKEPLDPNINGGIGCVLYAIAAAILILAIKFTW